MLQGRKRDYLILKLGGGPRLFIFYRESRRTALNVLLGALEASGVLDKICVVLLDGDRIVREQRWDIILKLLRKEKRSALILSILTPSLDEYFPLFKIKREGKIPEEVKLFVGGPHASGDPLGTLLLGADVAFIGESEESFPEVVERYLVIEEDIEDIKVRGICRSVDEELYYDGPPRPVDLDEYPPYFPRGKMYNPIEITRGCPFGCIYCQVTYLFGSKPRHRSIECIGRWCMEMLQNGRRVLRFITPNALSYGGSGKEINEESIESLLELFRRLKEKGAEIYFGSFPSEIRPEFVDRSILEKMKDVVNNRKIVIGMQSGSDRVLKELHRGHTVDDVISAVKTCLECGFQVDVDVIFGFPFEKMEDIQESVNVCRKLASMGARIHIHYFMPLPGTPLHDAVPRKPTEEELKLYGELSAEGRLFGQFQKQIEISKKIVSMRMAKIIRSLRENIIFKRRRRVHRALFEKASEE